jgi:8-oxo-dGTP diphosphatase
MKDKFIAFVYKFFAHPLRLIYYFLCRPKTKGVKALIQYKDSLLFIQNTYGYSYWNFPGGGVQKGESPKNAILREAVEEVGIKLPRLKLCGSFINTTQYKTDTVYVFLAKVSNSKFKIDPKEIKKAKWIKISDLKKILKKPVVLKSLELAKINY